MNRLLAMMLAALVAVWWCAPTPSLASPDHVEPVPTREGFNPPDLMAAKARAAKVPTLVKDVLIESPYKRRQAVLKAGLGVKDVERTYYLLDSPLLKEDCKDLYAPVHFMHGKHVALLKEDCSACHHLRPKDHEASDTVACDSCHQRAFDPAHPDRLGLKAAYHNQCMGCHEKSQAGPTGCTECHALNAPDHKELVKLGDKPSPQDVTRECLRCHDKQGEDMLKTAHWLWRGPSPYTADRRKEIMSGKGTNTINNFCIALPSNEPRCTSCHAGYGWKDKTFDFSNKDNIDCLVCHDTTGTYKKVPTGAGMPDSKVDLVNVAHHVGKPDRGNCGACHMSGGGGDAVKHADMSSQLLFPRRSCDVHMGGYDFQCQYCHKTIDHKISGRSSSVPVAEGSRTCEDCHTSKPHYGQALLDHHLNRHTEHMACNTCHVPLYSKCKTTKTFWDWSKAGDKTRKPVKDKYGMDDYFWKKGEFRWKESAKPEYAWFTGSTKRLLLGDPVEGEVADITRPVGEIADPKARIAPFKIMRGVQAVDAKHRYLLVPHLFPSGKDDTTAFWKTAKWGPAFEVGMKAAGLPYSGSYDWMPTRMYWKVNHEVAPKESALSCVQCHDSLKGGKTCDRCHQDSRDVDFKKLAHRGTDFEGMHAKGRDVSDLVGASDYIGFKQLGYKGDPILYGGRFKKLPLGYSALKP